MALTVTAVNNAQAIGGTAGEALLVTKTSLQAGTSFLQLEAALTSAASVVADPTRTVRLRWAVSSVSLTASAASAVAALARCSHALDIRPSLDAGGVCISQTGLVRVAGTYLYTWFESATLEAAAAVTLTATEF
jgi:hypothetical protein